MQSVMRQHCSCQAKVWQSEGKESKVWAKMFEGREVRGREEKRKIM